MTTTAEHAPDTVLELVDFVDGVTFNQLPDHVQIATIAELLDTVGCALGGTSVLDVAALARVAGGERPGNRGSLWGRAEWVSAADAAMINGTVGHALEYDDTHDEGALHVGVTVIPAAIAAAESVGASGAVVLGAIVAGIEVAARLAMASTVGPGVSGWLLTPLCGYFGAAAAAGKVLGLSRDQMVHAFGLAYSQAAGNGQATLDGGEAKRLQAGLAARGGVLSAFLAREGVTASRRVFEGTRGYFRVYHGDNFDKARLLDGLGETFEVARLTLKPYPCCRWTHAAIETAFALRKHGIPVDRIESVSVVVNQQAYNSTGSDPERRQRPRTPIEAQFSIPYAFASAYLTGGITLADFEPTAIVASSTIGLSTKVMPAAGPALEGAAARNLSGAVATITTTDGNTVTAQVDAPRRIVPARESLPLVEEKFMTLCDFGAQDPRWAASMRERIEDLAAVGSIAEFLPGSSSK